MEDHWTENLGDILASALAKDYSCGSKPTWTTTKVIPKQQPATPASPAERPKRPAPLMKATLRLHFTKFNSNFVPQDTIYTMVRNQVVAGNGSVIPNEMIDWCEKNCSDLWMPSPPDRPEYIMFALSGDMDLFLMTFGGG